MTADAPSRKERFDALLLKLPGVIGKKLNGLDAYFVGDRMFACVTEQGIGLRLPVAVATELQFSNGNVVPFKPGGSIISREWVQIEREDAAEHEKDLQLFRDSLEFVKTAPRR
jgi:hypothetical protein